MLLYEVDGRGRAILADLPPGIPLTVRVADELRFLGEETSFVLGPDERRELVLRIPPQDASCSGFVLDAGGAALEGAWVRLASEDGNGLRAVTDRDGYFCFPHLHRGRADLEAGFKGHVWLTMRDVELRPDAAPITLKLTKGYCVHVVVADESGRPITRAKVEAATEAEDSFYGVEVDDGRYRIKDAPDGELRVTADFAGRIYERRHPAREPECRITVPVHGSVRFVPEHIEPLESPPEVVFEPLTAAGARVTLKIALAPQSLRWADAVSPLLPGKYRWELRTQDDEPRVLRQGEVDIAAGVEARITSAR
jgi:hypothetical protein